LVCKGDGDTCWRLIDTKTGDFAHRDTTETVRKEMPCSGRDCILYQQKKCKEVMNLQFLLPSIPGLGVWQLDTSSYHSIVAVNSAIELIRNICGRISMIPLRLTIEPKEVSPDGKKKTVNILQIRTDITLTEIQKLGALPPSQVMLPPPDEDKPELLFDDTETVEPEVVSDKIQAKKDIDELWPDDDKLKEETKAEPDPKPKANKELDDLRVKIYEDSKTKGYAEQQVKDLMQMKFMVGNTKDLTKKQALELIVAISKGEGL
jgi:hypothetical protein